jgi:predicted RNA-binding Zn-ribbon protein involved in translation (DUF1610 family)
MTIIKRGHCDSSIVVSSLIYSCSSCGNTEIAKGNKEDFGDKECPQCHEVMKLISSQSESK